MAGGVNIKMGVTGVAQFKQSISQAKQNLKTLDAQLKLTETQYKATGDSETYMQQKTEQLKSKLEEQKAIAANAEKALQEMAERGVDKGSKAFQEMIRTLATAKGDMLNTQMALDGVAESSEEAGDNVSEMNQQLKRIGDGINYQNVTEGLGTITDGIGSVIRKAWQMGEELVKATLGAGSWADELMTTAAQYEITPEELQRMRKTANLIDTDVETILDAQDKLKKNREQSGKEFMGALAYLGIDPKGKDDLSLFWEAGEAIKNLGKNQDKVTYAQRIFGKSWRELLPLFTAGREEYEKTNASWNVLEQDQLDNLGKMDDAYQKMQGEWETFKYEMLSAFSGPLTEGMDTITGLFRELNNYLDTPEGQEMLKQIGDTISSLITDLTQINPEEVVGGLKSVIDDITKALKWISENKDTVVKAMEGILFGWGALTLTGGALQVLQLINGLKGLNGRSPTLPFTTTPTTPTTPTTTPTTQPTTGTNGGIGTGVVVTTTKAAANAASFLTKSGMILPVVGDRFTNETNTGRALRDGGDVLYGLQQDIEEFTSSVEENAKTFEEDWKNNGLVQGANSVYNAWLKNGDNTAKFWGGAFNSAIRKLELGFFSEEFIKKGEEALARTEEITEEYKNSEMFNLWDPLNEWLKTPGKTGSTKMDEFADHYMQWFNDELQDPMLDKLSEMMTDEDFDRITDAMSAWKNGGLLYNDEDRADLLDSMDRMLTLVEQEMGIDSGKNGNKEMTDAAKGMKTVPGEVEKAITRSMSGIGITIDGDVLVGYVNNRQATMIS